MFLIKLLRGTYLLAISQGISQICSFIRNVIVARFISPEDFGIATTFVITITFLQMITNAALETYIIQSSDNNEELVQNNAQLLLIFRGVLLAALILVFANQITMLFGTQEQLWAYYLLAIISILDGFVNLDMYREQRNLNYKMLVGVEITTTISLTLLAWPFSFWFEDYRVLLYLLIIKSFLTLLGSHLVAKRKYALKFNLTQTKLFYNWGWPLMLNGLFLYGILQGDRLIISTRYSLSDLGIYSVAWSLTQIPAQAIKSIHLKIVLPIFSQLITNSKNLIRRFQLDAYFVLFSGTSFGVIFIVAGDKLIAAIYGGKYIAAAAFIGWLGAANVFSIYKILPNTLAMSFGNTKFVMISNLTRIVSLPIILLIIIKYGGDLIFFTIISFIAEIITFLITFYLLNRVYSMGISLYLKPLLISQALLLAVVLFIKTCVLEANILLKLIIVFSVLFIYALVMLYSLMSDVLKIKFFILIRSIILNYHRKKIG